MAPQRSGPVYSLQSCAVPEAAVQDVLLAQAVSALRSIAAWDADAPNAAARMKERAARVLDAHNIPPHNKRGSRQG